MSRDISTTGSRRLARRLAALGSTAVATVAFGGVGLQPASAVDAPVHALFLQTNDPAGNAIKSFKQNADGSLTPAGIYMTGGNGGTQEGAVADPLASQGGLTYDPEHHLLFAVNEGSDTFTVFAVHGTVLERRQVLGADGHLPSSISVQDNLVYVLDAGGNGAITGFRIERSNRVVKIRNTTRSLGLGNPATPNFLKSPSQVLISPDLRTVVVATKSNGVLDVFRLRHGVPSAAPVVNASAAPVPFALLFDDLNRLLVTEASGSESSYKVRHNGELQLISGPVGNGQKAGCWSVIAKGFVYVANSGSNTITGYAEDWHGRLTLLNANGVTATTDAAPVDLVASADGRFLYQHAAVAGVVDEFAVNDDGSLTRIGTLTGLTPTNMTGPEGIAAS
jgi:6-phosphogluconolactonase (cycloisomerase 2 family)